MGIEMEMRSLDYAQTLHQIKAKCVVYSIWLCPDHNSNASKEHWLLWKGISEKYIKNGYAQLAYSRCLIETGTFFVLFLLFYGTQIKPIQRQWRLFIWIVMDSVIYFQTFKCVLKS